MKFITLDLRRPHRPHAASESLDQVPTADGAGQGGADLGVIRTVIDIPNAAEPPEPRIPPLALAVEHCGRTVVLAVDGDVDLHTAPAVRQVIESALSHRPKRLVVDLSLVRFLNSAGLEVLLAAHRRAGRHTDLRVVATSRATWRPLQITRLHEQLIIHASRSAAIAAPAGTDDPPGKSPSTPPSESTES